MSDYRGRGRGGFRGRGGPLRGYRGGSRGGFSDRDDGDRGGFRGRGGPPRRMDRDDSPPPRKVPMMSNRFDSERPRGPPPNRRDRFDDGFDERDPPPRSRDFHQREDRFNDRGTPPMRGFRDRDSGGNGFPSARGDFLPPRSRSPLMDSRDSYQSRDERRGPPPRDFQPRSAPRGGSYRGARPSREFRDPPPPRDHPRDFGHGRDDFRDSLPAKDSYRAMPPRERFSSRDVGGRDMPLPRRAPRRDEYDDREDRSFNARDFSDDRVVRGGRRDYPAREFNGRGGPRGDRDDYSGGPRGRGGAPFRGRGGPPRGRGGPPSRGRGRSDFSEGRIERRSSYDSRDAPMKRPRSDMDGGYGGRR